MCVRTSDRGEPAKIALCRLRTDSVENSPNFCSGGLCCDGASAGDWIARSINCRYQHIRFDESSFGINQRESTGVGGNFKALTVASSPSPPTLPYAVRF